MDQVTSKDEQVISASEQVLSKDDEPKRSNAYMKVLYHFSLFILVALFLALCVASPLETIIQIPSTGKFWNAIIIVAAYVLTAVIVIVLALVRGIRTRRSLMELPRRYMPHPDDMGKQIAGYIRTEHDRCKDVQKRAAPAPVEHDGAMNPKDSDEVVGSYYEVVELTVRYVMDLAVEIHPSLKRSPRQPVREWFVLLKTRCNMDNDLVAPAVQLYENCRFSGKPMSHQDFSRFLYQMLDVLFAVRQSVDQGPGGTLPLTPQASRRESISTMVHYITNSSLSPTSTRLAGLVNSRTSNAQADSDEFADDASATGSVVVRP